jgi:hypothetical protein
MFEPLGRGRRKRKSPPPKVCMTPGCGRVLIHRWKWLCDGCFAALPYLRKKEICEARKAQQCARVFGLSRDAGQFLAEQRARRADA